MSAANAASLVTDPIVLAIDLGTGGPKVAVVDARGVVLGWRAAAVGTTLLPGGGAEQSPDEMWTAVVSATGALFAALPAGCASMVRGIAVTSQYMSTIPIGGDGLPVGPCVLWMDTRGGDHNMTLLDDESFMLFVERHGLMPLPSGNDGVAHIEVLRRHHPSAFAAATAFVEPMDYLTARMTGAVAATQSSMFSQLVCDNRTWNHTAYDDDLVAATRRPLSTLPTLVPMNSVIGSLRASVAAELGLADGLPVVAGTIDSITSAIGCGAIDPSTAGVIIGTTSVIATHIGEHRGDLLSGLLAVPSPLSQRWYVMAENGLGGRALEWALRLLGYGHDGAGVDTEAALADAATVPAGAEGVRFSPWLLGSIAPQPDDDARASWVGLSLAHGRAHMVRSVVEGVAANLAWLLPAVESFAGGAFERVTFGGGGAQSALWAQTLADAFGRPVSQLADPRATNARGAGLLALDALGLCSVDQVAADPPVLHTFEPGPGAELMQSIVASLPALHPLR